MKTKAIKNKSVPVSLNLRKIITSIPVLLLPFYLSTYLPLYSDTSTYTFATGGGTDKWVYTGSTTVTPPLSGPDITDETLQPGFYSQISTSDDNRSTATANGLSVSALKHFKFKISEPTSSIKSIYIEWEGYSETDDFDNSKLYIASTSVSGMWTYISFHANLFDTVLSTTIVNPGKYLRVWPSSTTIDFILVSDPGNTYSNMYTDYVKVLVNYDPFYSVWNSAETESTESVAWGDYDNDGDLDQLIGNYSGQTNRVYRNNGNNTWTSIWNSPELEDTVSAAWGDYDNDGDLDIAVGNRNTQTNRVYRNNGNNTWTSIWNSTELEETCCVAWGDYDNDGDLDIAVGNDGQTNRVYRNNGDNTFISVWNSADTEATYSVAWGDYDNDGDLDLLAGNYSNTTNRVYRNNGNNTWTSIWNSAELEGTMSVAWGDYDNDGDLDFAAGNLSQTNRVYRNNGNNTWTSIWNSTELESTMSVAWGDYDNDGDLDLACGNDGQTNCVYRNNGNNTFTSVWNSVEIENTQSVAWGDYDNDGDLDIAVGNRNTQTNRIYKSLIAEKYGANTAPGVPPAAGDFSSNYNSSLNQLELRWYNVSDSGAGATPSNGLYYLIRIATEPIPNNPLKWIVSGSTGAGATPFLGNYPHGFCVAASTTAGVNIKSTLQGTTYYWQVKSIDAGLRASTSWSGSQQIYVPTSPPGKVTGFTAAIAGQVQLSWVAPGNDNYTGNVTGGAWQIKYSTTSWANPGTAEFTIEKSSDWTQGSTHSLLVTGLKPRATHYFWIRARDEASNNWSIWSDTATAVSGSFILYSEPMGQIGLGAHGSVSWADFDNDGDLDLAVNGYDGSNNRFQIYRNDNNYFVFHSSPAGPDGIGFEGCISWADFDNDGDLDIAVNGADSIGPKCRIYRNDNGTFNLQTSLTNITAGGLSWGDFDNDGDPDLVVNGWDGSYMRFVIYRNNNGTFNVYSEPAGATNGFARGTVRWGDYDNDGDLDIAVNGCFNNNWSDTRFRVYRNDNGSFSNYIEPAGASGPGQWGGVAWGDYDNDGDLDIAVNGTVGDATTGTRKFSIYRNDGGTFNLQQDVAGIGSNGAVEWGDYDNDGDLDIAVIGNDGSNARFAIYRNDNNTFNLASEPAGVPGLNDGRLAWGDFDSDGDLDIAINGGDAVAARFRIYKSLEADYYGANSAPAAPSPATLSTNYNSSTGNLELRWGYGDDSVTPAAGLYYSVRIATEPISTDNLKSWIVSPSTGAGASPLIGNYPHGFTAAATPGLNLKLPQENATYYWQVRTIDAGLKAGPWSTTTSTYVPYVPPAAPTGFEGTALSTVSIRWNWIDNATNETGYRVRESISYIVFTLGAGVTYYVEPSLSPNTSYYRYAEAYRAVGPTSTSAGVTRYTLANPPLSYTLGNVFFSSITVSWSANSNPSGTNFEVYRSTNNINFTVVYTTSTQAFTDTGLEPLTTYYYKICALNGDGIATDFSATVSTITKFNPFSSIWNSAELENTRSVAWGDYDNDGDLDQLVGNMGETNRVYRNNGDGTWTSVWNSAETESSRSVAWGDYDNDGDLDQLVGNLNQTNRVYRNNGNGTWTSIWNSAELEYSHSVAWGDYDNDGDLDQLIGNGAGGFNQTNRVYRNNGDGTWTSVWNSAETESSRSVAWGDYDNDGDLDQLIGNGDNQTNRIYRNNGDGTFTSIWNSLETEDTRSVAWGDYDNDGDLDFAIGNVGQTNRVYKNNGDGTFTSVWNSPETEQTLSVAWGDYDNDGDLDILAGNYAQANRIYRNNGDGTFTSIWDSVELENTGSVAWGDYDNDGDLDILAGNETQTNRVYKSFIAEKYVANTQPDVISTGFSSNYISSTDKLELRWDYGTDSGAGATPQKGLYYSVIVATEPLTLNPKPYIVSPSTGVGASPLIGNYPHGFAIATSTQPGLNITPVIKNVTYYWQVKAIDAGLKAGPWSSIQSIYVSTYVVTVASNTAPVLSWTGETNYTGAGLYPVTGSTSTTFAYRVKYTDVDNDAPMSGYPKLHIKKGNSEITGSPFTMNVVDSADVTYTDGKLYSYSTTLSSGTDYTYYFEALDSKSAVATGTPITSVDAPDVSAGKDTTVVVTPVGGGTLVVTKDTGQEMKVEVPANTFTSDVSMNVSILEPASIPESYQPEIKKINVGLSITIPTYSTPQNDITITIVYTDADITGINEDLLGVAYYEEKSKRWVTLPTYTHDKTQNKILVLTRSLTQPEVQYPSVVSFIQAQATAGSVTKFTLVEIKPAATTLKDAYAYPSLFRYADGIPMNFANLTPNAKVSVFSISGNFVWEGQANEKGALGWNGFSVNNERLGTGVYVVYISDGKDKKVIKVIITR